MESNRKAGMFSRSLTIHSPHELPFFPSDAVVSQVLDELGLSLTDELSSKCSKPFFSPPKAQPQPLTLILSADLPSTGGSLSVAAGGKKAEATASALADADADLEERLKNLRRD